MIGAAVLVYGIITVIHYFTKKDTVPKLLLFTGIVIAVIGLSIFAFPDWLLKFIPKLAGVIILIDGAANLVETMTLGKQNYKKWWLSDTYRYGETAFLPKRMTPETLQDGCLRIRTEFYSLPCILHRFFGNIGNMSPMTALVFLLANFVSGREIRAKQGQLLGGVLGASDTDQTEYRQA